MSTIPALSSFFSGVPSFQIPGFPSSMSATTSAPSATVNPPPTGPQGKPSAPVNIPSTNGHNISATPASSPPNVSTSNLCEMCHARPKYNDGTKTHLFCGKSCANAAKVNKAAAQSGNCVVCHTRPRYNDGTRTHAFCSMTCARKMKPSSPVNNGLCHIAGCNKPVHKSSGGVTGKYCGNAHKTLGETVCIMCRKAPKQGDRHFCGSACADDAKKAAPMLLEIPEDHVTFRSVADQFKTSWRHTNSHCPAVRHIYKIVAPQDSLDKYDQYRAKVESKGQFVAAGRSEGNENRRWHGTKRECTLGDQGQTQFCSSTTCSLCCIMKSSYDISLWGTKTGWGRFGAGIYTSSTSSKSNDYSTNVDSQAKLKAILLNKVVVGKGYKMTQDSTTMSAPPAGYDSVLAEKGSRLNHDELVVYDNDAIRPSYLVMYDTK